MKKFQKMIAIGAAFAMAMSMGVSAFAEDAVEGFVADVTHELAEGVETYSTLNIEHYAPHVTLGEDNTQYTVVLIPAEAENATLTDAQILYLNQGEKGELFWASMGTKAGTLTAGDYILRVGCEDGSIQEAKITVKAFEAEGPSKIQLQLGDVNFADGVGTPDVNAVLDHMLGITILTGNAFIAADANQADNVGTPDVNAILDHMLGIRLLGTIEVDAE